MELNDKWDIKTTDSSQFCWRLTAMVVVVVVMVVVSSVMLRLLLHNWVKHEWTRGGVMEEIFYETRHHVVIALYSYVSHELSHDKRYHRFLRLSPIAIAKTTLSSSGCHEFSINVRKPLRMASMYDAIHALAHANQFCRLVLAWFNHFYFFPFSRCPLCAVCSCALSTAAIPENPSFKSGRTIFVHFFARTERRTESKKIFANPTD